MVGPLVVFGFLVLPALAALRVAPGLVAAFVHLRSGGGALVPRRIRISYRADLPAGPICVAVAAACWACREPGDAPARPPARRRAAAARAPLCAPSLGCASRFAAAAQRAASPLPRGTLPEAVASRPDHGAALRRTPPGSALSVPEGFLDESRARPASQPAGAGHERARRAPAARGASSSSAAASRWSGPGGAACAASRPTTRSRRRAAPRRPASTGPVLTGTLRRFTLTGDGAAARAARPRAGRRAEPAACCGPAPRPRPVPIPSALTWQEILLDAGAPIFADAFGNR